MQERQEFLDRFFVFSGQDWTPPRDWTRANGLVEEIRKSYAEIEEDRRMELEASGPGEYDRGTSEPIELPGAPRVGGAAPEPAGRRRAPTPPATATPPAAAPATPPAPAPAQPTGQNEADSPLRISPIARSVNVERVE
jgi:general secretion pathway protein D